MTGRRMTEATSVIEKGPSEVSLAETNPHHPTENVSELLERTARRHYLHCAFGSDAPTPCEAANPSKMAAHHANPGMITSPIRAGMKSRTYDHNAGDTWEAASLHYASCPSVKKEEKCSFILRCYSKNVPAYRKRISLYVTGIEEEAHSICSSTYWIERKNNSSS